jgi:hypothetical protein
MENETRVSYFLYVPIFIIETKKNRDVKKIKCCPLNLK